MQIKQQSLLDLMGAPDVRFSIPAPFLRMILQRQRLCTGKRQRKRKKQVFVSGRAGKC